MVIPPPRQARMQGAAAPSKPVTNNSMHNQKKDMLPSQNNASPQDEHEIDYLIIANN